MKNQKRYRLNEDEWKLIDDYRQDKKNKALLEKFLQNQMSSQEMNFYKV